MSILKGRIIKPYDEEMEYEVLKEEKKLEESLLDTLGTPDKKYHVSKKPKREILRIKIIK